MGDSHRPTLIKPPPADPNKAPIENVLEVTELSVLGPNIFTNTRQPWHPSGARGIFGGAVIAMCLAAGQRTVPDAFTVHSCHCYFILAGASEVPILLHVEKVRDGRSFATRTVQARQRGRPIFTVTMSFAREGGGGARAHEVRHAHPMPADPATGRPLAPPPDDYAGEPELANHGPYQGYRIEVANRASPHPHERRSRTWVRARGRISEAGGHQAHLNALAYMSDSYFIGTVARSHRLWRFPFRQDELPALPRETRDQVRRLVEFEGFGTLADLEGRPGIGMMVSLDHAIYFHAPRRFRADEWMLCEMESPWAGDGRGVVTQRIWAKDGTLLATCVQEGVVRLKDTDAQPADQDGGQGGKPKL